MTEHIFDDSVYESTLPLSQDDLLATSWSGINLPSMPTGDVKPWVIASTFPSAKSPGYVHYEVIAMPEGVATYSKRPFHPVAVGLALDLMLKPYGVTAADLKWQKSDQLPPDADQPRSKALATVYFIQSVAGGLVKIGVSNHAESRLAALQTGCPVELRIVKRIDKVPRTREAEIHKHFAAYRAHGEWFDPIVLTLDLAA